jgi:hypothetical protein
MATNAINKIKKLRETLKIRNQKTKTLNIKKLENKK